MTSSSSATRKSLSKIACNRLQNELVECQVNPPLVSSTKSPTISRAADILLWRNKRNTGIVLGAGTAFWVFFELMEYHLITFLCHLLILSLAALFLWSNASVFIHKSPLHIPHVSIPEQCVLEVSSALRIEINRAVVLLREIGTGRDIKKDISGFEARKCFTPKQWTCVSRAENSDNEVFI